MVIPLIDSVASIAKFSLDYAVVLAALGVLSMALLEAWKKLRDTQAKFHRSAVLRWIRNDPSDKSHYRAHQPARAAQNHNSFEPFDPALCYEELIQLTTGLGLYTVEPSRRFETSNELERAGFGAGSFSRSIEYALFELELVRMMGQIQEAADVALNNPNRYKHLFMFLTRGVDDNDINAWWQTCHSGKMAATDRSDADRKDLADLYTRIKQAVRRHLDSFQIVTALRWREWNQLAALIVGAVLMFVAQVIALDGGWSAIQDAGDWVVWLKMIAIALFGGMLAPVAKELVDALAAFKKNG